MKSTATGATACMGAEPAVKRRIPDEGRRLRPSARKLPVRRPPALACTRVPNPGRAASGRLGRIAAAGVVIKPLRVVTETVSGSVAGSKGGADL